jgi:hypothetical protein
MPQKGDLKIEHLKREWKKSPITLHHLFKNERQKIKRKT